MTQVSGDIAAIAAGLTVSGRMDDGSPAIFSVEARCGNAGFIGRCVDANDNVICKPGYIPFGSLDEGQAATVRAYLEGNSHD